MSIVEETAVLIDVEEATPIDKAGPTGEAGAILTDGEGTTPTDGDSAMLTDREEVKKTDDGEIALFDEDKEAALGN